MGLESLPQRVDALLQFAEVAGDAGFPRALDQEDGERRDRHAPWHANQTMVTRAGRYIII